MLKSIKDMVLDIEKDIIQWRRELHQIPEVAHDVPKTAEYIAGKLDQFGVPYKRNVGGHGIVALITGSKPGRTFGIRADIDALAIEEETGLPFSSTHKGKMHACGHDAHMAMALGATKVLNSISGDLPGKVKILFQPAEEGPGGAKPMIEEGAMKDPVVDAIIGLHVGGIFKEVQNGQVGIGRGAIMACLDSFRMTVWGKGGHGAMPNATVDPIMISSYIIQALQTLISRELKPTSPGVITIGTIQGGTAYNIIPEKVELLGTARFIQEEDRTNISKRIGELASQIAVGMRGRCEFEYTYGYPPLVCDEQFTDFFKGIAEEVVGSQNVVTIDNPTMGGEDMAYFLKEAQGTFFFLGSVKQGDATYPHHHPKFDLDESVFWRGSALLAETAFRWLKSNG
ncbi:MAG: amidohydrolase [Flavobacteriales bacterium]|nr:amidohydrolase [Flavobacteriales bacterium]